MSNTQIIIAELGVIIGYIVGATLPYWIHDLSDAIKEWRRKRKIHLSNKRKVKSIYKSIKHKP